MTFQEELRNLGEHSGERALTESIIAAYEALLESDMTADTPIPDSKVYVNADGSQVIGMTWGDDPRTSTPILTRTTRKATWRRATTATPTPTYTMSMKVSTCPSFPPTHGNSIHSKARACPL